ncbi:hypothetical protein [Mesoflavibacter zeaxanthinifaciens]|uniref:hypothetical protein n=1 Tax=Mesoflavibacter zeaxanthinifaciens TaxID=393060 RepID=UPI0003FC4916|nr:hypothetical protein [Mesoflavibacter zeaxanthinifaciens]
MKKQSYIFLGILSLTFISIVCIHFNNDHKECFDLKEQKVLQDGTVVKVEKHICNEKYNF